MAERPKRPREVVLRSIKGGKGEEPPKTTPPILNDPRFIYIVGKDGLTISRIPRT